MQDCGKTMHHWCFIILGDFEYFTTDDIGNLLAKLNEFSPSDWFTFGINLDIKYQELKTIESDFKSESVLRCLIECLATWIKIGKATNVKLAKALEKTGYIALAENISELLIISKAFSLI